MATCRGLGAGDGLCWLQILQASSRTRPHGSTKVLTIVLLAWSGTEWFEAGDADSGAPSPSSFARADQENTSEPEEAPVGQRLDLALLTAADRSTADMLGHAAQPAAGRPPAGSALLKAAETHGGVAAGGHLGPVMLRIFPEVSVSIPLLHLHAGRLSAAHCAFLSALPTMMHLDALAWTSMHESTIQPVCLGRRSMQQTVFLTALRKVPATALISRVARV